MFEQELSRLCAEHRCIGAQQESPLVYDLLQPVHLSDALHSTGELPWNDLPHVRAEFELRRAQQILQITNDQQQAYLGWLVTNVTFASEIQQFRQQHGDGYADDAAGPDFDHLCRKWQLRGMATWDLPLPLLPNLSGMELPYEAIASQEVHLSLPPTLNLPTRFPLHEIIADEPVRVASPISRSGSNSWLGTERAETGMARYQRMFKLHFYRNCVLAQRFADRFAGQAALLDEAFAVFFGDCGADSIKKIRLAMARRLRRG